MFRDRKIREAEVSTRWNASKNKLNLTTNFWGHLPKAWFTPSSWLQKHFYQNHEPPASFHQATKGHVIEINHLLLQCNFAFHTTTVRMFHKKRARICTKTLATWKCRDCPLAPQHRTIWHIFISPTLVNYRSVAHHQVNMRRTKRRRTCSDAPSRVNVSGCL